MSTTLSPCDLALLVAIGTGPSAPGPRAGSAASEPRHQRLRMGSELIRLDALTRRHLQQQAAE